MKLSGTCIFTNDVLTLSEFYEFILMEEPEGDKIHMSFNNSQLAIYNPGNVIISKHKNMSLMYTVDDVDMHYNRLSNSEYNIEFVRAPENMPWGVRSFIFKDLDGNEVSILTPIK